MMGLEAKTTIRADASVAVGKRTLFVISRAQSVTGFGGEAYGVLCSPIALLVDESGDLYSRSLTEDEMTVEEILSLVPSLKEKVRGKMSDV